MKANNFIFGVILIMLSSNAVSQKVLEADSVIYSKISKYSNTKFVGKKAEIFLNWVGPFFKVIESTEPPGVLRFVIFKLNENYSVDIAVNNWDKLLTEGINIDEFKQKKISWICFRYKGKCFKGNCKSDRLCK